MPKLEPPVAHPPYPFPCYVKQGRKPASKRVFKSRILAQPTGLIDAYPFYQPRRERLYSPASGFPTLGDERFQYPARYPEGAVPAFWNTFHVDPHTPVAFTKPADSLAKHARH